MVRIGWLAAAIFGVAAGGCAGRLKGNVDRAIEASEAAAALTAYEQMRAKHGSDRALLTRVAAAFLVREARSPDARLRQAAFAQLMLAGTAARESLERLAEPGVEAPVRARALRGLARLGDGSAQDALAKFVQHPDPEVLAAAVMTLDPLDDRDRLVALLRHGSSQVRREAASRLAGAAPDAHIQTELATVARVDVMPKVRAGAVRSLAAFGASGFDALRECLADPDVRVRLAAVRALARAHPTRASAVVGDLLARAPDPLSVEAARVVAMRGGSASRADKEVARAFLKRALLDGDARTQSQAAVALTSFRDRALRPALLEALRTLRDPQTRLSLAMSLHGWAETRTVATRALAQLLSGSGVPAIQAAGVLARQGHAPARQRLAVALRDQDALHRRIAARRLARDARQPEAARLALADSDALVRIHAAGGILAVSTSGRD